MAKKTSPPAEPKLPPSHHAALQRHGFAVIYSLPTAIRVTDGERDWLEWLPALCVAPGGKPGSYRILQWLPKEHPSNGYGFDGWKPSSGTTNGGMYREISQALGWFTWHDEQKAKAFGPPGPKIATAQPRPENGRDGETYD